MQRREFITLLGRRGGCVAALGVRAESSWKNPSNWRALACR